MARTEVIPALISLGIVQDVLQLKASLKLAIYENYNFQASSKPDDIIVPLPHDAGSTRLGDTHQPSKYNMPGKEQLLIVNEFHPETVAALSEIYTCHHMWQLDSVAKKSLIQKLDGRCRAAASASWVCDPAIFELNSLQLIACFGVGVDGIDFHQTRAAGIRVSNTPDVLNDAVADVAMALILATTRAIPQADKYVRAGQWLDGPYPFGHGLAGKTLGIIGLGRIGEAIVHRALPFKLNIAYHNRSPKPVPYSYYASIEELAQHSDILLNMLPGGPETADLIGSKAFQQLGPTGVFINVGRGSSVNEMELVSALQNNAILGAGLDVYANEPNVPQELLQLNNVVLLPHIGSATFETRRAMGNLVIDNLRSFFDRNELVTEYVQPR
ncbi:MAG: 2-hydroxyacid dehydrogenase [Gammaproteobacteria bacterium]